MSAWFRKFSAKAAELSGSAPAFVAAVLFIVVWAVTGPIFHFSDAWQLIINSVTNIITLLMVFLIQNSQNRDSKAIQLKLDELLRGVEGARTGLVDLEDLSDEDLKKLQQEFEKLRNNNIPPMEDRNEMHSSS